MPEWLWLVLFIAAYIVLMRWASPGCRNLNG